MKRPTAKTKIFSVQVIEPTHRTLKTLKAQRGVSITRLIDQGVAMLLVARTKSPKQSVRSLTDQRLTRTPLC